MHRAVSRCVLCAAYENQTNNDLYMDCSENQNATKDKLCRFDLKQFKDCSKDKAYGYMTGQPCVFLKLNKVQTLCFMCGTVLSIAVALL